MKFNFYYLALALAICWGIPVILYGTEHNIPIVFTIGCTVFFFADVRPWLKKKFLTEK